MEQYIPANVFMNNIGNGPNGSYPFSIKEHFQLGLVSKEFHAASTDKLLAKAIDREFIDVGPEMSELLMSSDFTIQCIAHLSSLIQAKENCEYEKVLFGFPTLSISKVFKPERKHRTNTIKVLQLLYQYFYKSNDWKEYTIVSTISSATIMKWLLSYVESVYGTSADFVTELFHPLILDLKHARKLMLTSLPLNVVIEAFINISCGNTELLKPGLSNIEEVWTALKW
jgi:hypothetical protein